MITPKYWARAVVDHDGRQTEDEWGFTGIGWSDTSEQDAQNHALKRAQRLRTWIVERDFEGGNGLGNTYYHNNVLREPVVNELHNDQGDRLAVVTRNIYGAYVLNATQAMFIDIDLPQKPKAYGLFSPEPGLFTKLIGKLFGSSPPPIELNPETTSDTPVNQIRDIVAKHPGMGLRLYRTPNGFRGLVTNQTYTPESDETQAILSLFGCDELYTRLCRAQQCFRARLTPKPWRIKMDLPPRNFPFTNPQKQTIFDRWNTSYEARITDYAACEPVEEAQLGNPDIHPEIAPVMTLHDELACAPGKTLA